METEFDLRSFQSEVFKDFTSLKLNLGAAHLYRGGYKVFQKKTELQFSKGGLLNRAVFSILSFFGKRMDKSIFNKSDFIEKEKKSAEIAHHPKIKEMLCQSLKREKWTDLLYEDMIAKMVKIITFTLTTREIMEEFSIEKDVRLFSLIILRIHHESIENYCGQMALFP